MLSWSFLAKSANQFTVLRALDGPAELFRGLRPPPRVARHCKLRASLETVAFMSLYLPVAFLLLQGLILGIFGPSVTGPAAYVLMVVAPLCAAGATFWRGRSLTTSVRFDWYALSLALTIWATGAFGNLWQELILGHHFEMYRASMLAFNLAVVPTTFLLASDWRLHKRPLLRAVDALVALALGCVYFQYTWVMIHDHSASSEAGVAYLVWLLDLQNLCLATGALARWYIAEDNDERDLFRSLGIYLSVYCVIVFINDHYFAGSPAFGPEYGTIVTIAFAALCHLALKPASATAVRASTSDLVPLVRSGSPILLAVALLAGSLFLVRVDYLAGCVGILIAVVGIGVRTTLMQVRQIEHREALQQTASDLQQKASALQTIAWTDALTSVPNRHYFAESLGRVWRERRPQEHAILMIDIDHFKLLNDRYGHPVGDGCLRDVARALLRELAQPGHVLARYGGEEFIALLRDTVEADAQHVAERLRAAVQDLRIENANSPEGVVTVSIGVASARLADEVAAARLVEHADCALYEAKCAGRNLVRLASEAPVDEGAIITARRRRLRR
jgi:diguanylate cyclase (GGDEF)-like protein